MDPELEGMAVVMLSLALRYCLKKLLGPRVVREGGIDEIAEEYFLKVRECLDR